MLPEDISKVENIIRTADEEIKSIEVEKKIPLQTDCGLLMVSDENNLDKFRIRNASDKDEYMNEIARDGIQVLLNHIWDLPTFTSDGLIYAQLPKTKCVLPREKRLPKPKPLTKWETFAKEKGMTKKKKAVKQWDDIVKAWVPRYGYQKVKVEREKNWLLEVPDGADPYEDQFKKAANAKKERVARNEYNRMKNIAKAQNVKVPNVGIVPAHLKSKSGLESALVQTHHSTASLGKFQANLKNDPSLRRSKKGQKRKAPPDFVTRDGVQEDNKRALNVLGKMKKKELDMEAAVNKKLRLDNVDDSQKQKKTPKSNRRSKFGPMSSKRKYKKPRVFAGTARQIKNKGKGKKVQNEGGPQKNKAKGAPGKKPTGKKMAAKGGATHGKGNKRKQGKK